MDALIFLLLIVIIGIILSKFSKLFLEIQRLKSEVQHLKQLILDSIEKERTVPKAPVVEPVPEPTPYKSLFTEIKEEIKDERKTSVEKKKSLEEKIPETADRQEEAPHFGIQPPMKPAPQLIPVKPGFFERHPDMEKYIGENLVNKIGIAVLVLAIGFFVKYAIDQNWVGPAGRVAIGILCGGVLVGLAHRLRKDYNNFSSVLAGGGMAVFYFTITLGYHQFQLFSQPVAFGIMTGITFFAVALSLLYDKQELAIIAMAGGFSAPFLVSSGSGNYQALFTYLIILNTGLLIIAYSKAWRLLNVLCFIFTVIIAGTWLQLLPETEPAKTYRNGFIFVTIFFLLFFLINIAHNIREKKKFIATDFAILLANTSLYFSAGIFCLVHMQAESYKGLFSASMGVFNLLATWLLFRKQKVDSNILYLLMGITLSFISLTAPLQLHGNYITLFWATEAVLLYWLYTKSKIVIIQYSSMLVWMLMLVSLLMDWTQVYGKYDQAINIVLNKGFVTTIFAACCTFILYHLVGIQEQNEQKRMPFYLPGKLSIITMALLILFMAGALEIYFQFNFYYENIGLDVIYLVLYYLSFVLLFTFISRKLKKINLPEQLYLLLYMGCIIFFLTAYPEVFDLQSAVYINHQYGVHFLAHWLSALLMGVVLLLTIQYLRKNNFFSFNRSLPTWIICFIVVLILSVEIELVTTSLFYSGTGSLEKLQTNYIKVGLPILWGLCSFAFMWLGMRYKFRPLRIISLTLFFIILLKLFVFDIRNIPAAGKIAAFFCLGVLLLVVSFMYQRLKKIIIDNEKVD